jgi:hypothetical protein
MRILSPEQSPLFTPWRDPRSGVESLIFNVPVAPVHKSFYFTHTSFSADGRFLWIECIFPPNRLPQLAVVDMALSTVALHPETQFDSRPFVDPVTAEVFWGIGPEIWKRGPLPADRPRLVNRLPPALVNQRPVHRAATHLSRSADGKSFAIDARIGSDFIIGDLPLDGSPFRPWRTVDRNYNHALFSPVDPDLMLISQDSWFDQVSGAPGKVSDRVWLIRRGGELQPVMPDDPLPSANRGHEWWHGDGESVWFLDYTEGPGQGTKRVHLASGAVDLVWPHGHSHSHCDRTGDFLVGDIVSWPEDRWQVAFFDRRRGREHAVVSLLPPCDLRGRYHVHPHPSFCLDDRYVCYTTNVNGRVDFALSNCAGILSS